MTRWVQNKNGVLIPRREAGFIQPGIGLMNKKQSSGPSDPYWSNVAFLLHGNGINGSTSIIDQKSSIWTANGGCNISTTQSKFNGSSIYFDGTSGYVSTPYNSLFHASGDFTFECWFYTTISTVQTILAINKFTGAATGADSYAEIRCDIHSLGNYIALIMTGNGPSWTYQAGGPTVPTIIWVFLTIVKLSGVVTLYINGISSFSFSSSAPVNNAGVTRIGSLTPYAPSQWFNGYMAELRYTVGIARYTTNFTPPSAPFPNHS